MLVETIFDFIFFGSCLTGIIWRLTLDDKINYILEYESWCILSEAFYYLIQTIIGIINTCNKTTDSCLQNFIKYTLFKIIFPPVLTCPFIYFLGDKLHWFDFETDTGKKECWCDVFNHIISPACILIDAILFKRQYSPSNLLDIIILTGIYIAYGILCLPFIESDDNYFINCFENKHKICALIFFYCIGMAMHFFYIIITRIRDCNTIEKKNK